MVEHTVRSCIFCWVIDFSSLKRYMVAGYAGAHNTTMSVHSAHARATEPRPSFRNAADNKDNNSILLPTFALLLLSFLYRKTFSSVVGRASPRRDRTMPAVLSCRSTYPIIHRGIGKRIPVQRFNIGHRGLGNWSNEIGFVTNC